MKNGIRALICGAALAALAGLPFRSTDAARLTPVRTVIVSYGAGRCEVDVGKSARGVGRDLSEALKSLRETLTGVLFLPTAEQIIVVDPSGTEVETVREVAEEPSFCPAAGLYRALTAELDAEAVGAYLQSHPSNTTVMKVRGELAMGGAPALPLLREENGGWLVETP